MKNKCSSPIRLNTLLLIPLTLVLFASCANMKAIQHINSYDVIYTDVSYDGKDIRFVEMSVIGQPSFYENVKRLIDQSQKEGYTLLYEKIKLEGISDTDLCKIRKMLGYIPSRETYEVRFKSLLKMGYVLWPTDSFTKANPSKVYADVSGTELIKAYEQQFGTIVLTSKDLSAPLTQSITAHRLPSKRVNSIMMRYRDSLLVKKIYASDYNKIIVLYDATHKTSFLKELDSLNGPGKVNATISTEDNSDFLQPLTADSLRKISDNHIKQNGYIDDMGDYVNVRLSLKNNFEFFHLRNNGIKYNINPNSGTDVRISADYKALSVWWTFSPSSFSNNKDQAQKGSSSGFSLGTSLIYSHWFHYLSWRFIKGFYIDNTKDFIPTWQTGDAYIKKPELYYTCLEGSSGYKFNPKFSLRSLTSQTERQLKSTGSVFVSGNYRYYETLDKSGPMVSNDSIDYVEESVNFELGLDIGYYHTFVVKQKFYISMGVSPGLGFVVSGVQKNSVPENKTIRTHHNFIFRLASRITLGYNGERVFSGIYGDFSGGDFFNTDVPIYNTDFKSLFQVFIGCRLEASRKLRTAFR